MNPDFHKCPVARGGWLRLRSDADSCAGLSPFHDFALIQTDFSEMFQEACGNCRHSSLLGSGHCLASPLFAVGMARDLAAGGLQQPLGADQVDVGERDRRLARYF